MNWLTGKSKKLSDTSVHFWDDVSPAASTGTMPDELTEWRYMRCKRCAKEFKTHAKATAHVCPFCGLDQKKGKR